MVDKKYRMKKISVLLILAALSVCARGQDTLVQQPEKSQKVSALSKHLLFKDRILVDIFSSYWFGLSQGVKQKPVNMGCHAAIMFDLPVKKNKPFSFGLGVGVTNLNLHSNAVWENNDGTTQALPCPRPDSVFKSNISFTYVNIPVEFRFFHSSGFKLAVGVRVGLMADIHSKYFGEDWHEGSNKKVQIKDYNIPGRFKTPVEFTFRTGWKFVGVNVSYMITKMFDKGPKINPISFGISLSIY